MSEHVRHIAEWSAAVIEIIGIGLITFMAVMVVVYFVVNLAKGQPLVDNYNKVRVLLGKGVLLGLEFLVAADIIHTVAVELTFETAGVLAIIVLIRTFLSFTLELELTGSWPWEQKGSK